MPLNYNRQTQVNTNLNHRSTMLQNNAKNNENNEFNDYGICNSYEYSQYEQHEETGRESKETESGEYAELPNGESSDNRKTIHSTKKNANGYALYQAFLSNSFRKHQATQQNKAPQSQDFKQYETKSINPIDLKSTKSTDTTVKEPTDVKRQSQKTQISYTNVKSDSLLANTTATKSQPQNHNRQTTSYKVQPLTHVRSLPIKFPDTNKTQRFTNAMSNKQFHTKADNISYLEAYKTQPKPYRGRG